MCACVCTRVGHNRDIGACRSVVMLQARVVCVRVHVCVGVYVSRCFNK